MNPLPRVRSGLLRHPLDEQVLVYDSSSEKVHLLDPTTACVLDLLEQGGWTREGVTLEIAERIGVAPSEGFLPLAIEELRRAGMLETVAEVAPLADVTRRDALRKLALTGASAMMIPTVATLMASNANAQSPGGALACQACSPAGSAGGCAPPNTCINGVAGGPRCSGGVNPTQNLAGHQETIDNPSNNCGGPDLATNQAAADARCCSGTANVTSCSGGPTGTITYTCA
jgi:hypothetical protein